MSIDLATALKAIELVRDIAPAIERLYEGFAALSDGADQAELQRRYAAAKAEADGLNRRMEESFPAPN